MSNRPSSGNHFFYRKALSQFATGVCIITVPFENDTAGITVNSFTSVSLDPPLVLWCLGKGSDRGQFFHQSAHFVINILSLQQKPLAEHCAKRGQYRLNQNDLDLSDPLHPSLLGSLARLYCSQHDLIEIGDHLAVVGQVHDFNIQEQDEAPLLYFRQKYHEKD